MLLECQEASQRVSREPCMLWGLEVLGKDWICKIYTTYRYTSYMTNDDTWLRWRPLIWVRRFHQWVICQLLGLHVSEPKRPQKVPNAICWPIRLKIHFIAMNACISSLQPFCRTYLSCLYMIRLLSFEVVTVPNPAKLRRGAMFHAPYLHFYTFRHGW